MIAKCERCGVPCIVGAAPPNDAPHPLVTMRAAQTAHGLCVTCAAHWWLHSVDGIRWAVEDGGPWVLGLRPIQEKLTPLMARMHPEFAALDWARMLAQWDMDWPKGWALPHDGING
jgi:hypothetical protein